MRCLPLRLLEFFFIFYFKADLVFSMATFFNVLQLTAAIFYPLAVSLGAEALVCFDPFSRENSFLINNPESNNNSLSSVDFLASDRFR